MKLYLDDIRAVPCDWIGATTFEEAVELLKTGRVVEASLDHDLGWSYICLDCKSNLCEDCTCQCHEAASKAPTGYDLVKWMAENNVWPSKLRIHSANPVGRANMQAIIDRYGPYKDQ